MSLGWSLAEIAARLGNLVGAGDGVILGVTTDSRAFDGHDFIEQAVKGGAAGVVAAAGRTSIEPRIEVAATGDALLELAAMRRDELRAPVVAVTGSTGKTTTKDMLASTIPGSWASPASYNNEVGVPLTVLQTPGTARALVVEMGSRGRGHLEWLMPAVRLVHLETFGDPATLADAKWEIVEGLAAEGVAVLPADEPRLMRNHAGETRTFGVETAADVVARDITVGEDGCARFTLETPQGRCVINLRMPGVHQPANAAAAAAAALAVGVDLDQVAIGLGGATGSRWRMEFHRGSFTVVNDAYNANPTSVEAALRTVADLPGRPIAVLGLMAELGEISGNEHTRMGRLAAELGYATVIMVGEDPGLASGAGAIARNVATADEALDLVARLVREGDTVLVKASRAVGLERLAGSLAELAGANSGGAP
jgi:UDP-N-acetylmuramoyl-tripeptide--D-alanyl-D-alanine ligase